MEAAGEAAVGSPWEAVGSHTAGVVEVRSRVAAGTGLEEGRTTAGGIAVRCCSSLGWPFCAIYCRGLVVGDCRDWQVASLGCVVARALLLEHSLAYLAQRERL